MSLSNREMLELYSRLFMVHETEPRYLESKLVEGCLRFRRASVPLLIAVDRLGMAQDFE